MIASTLEYSVRAPTAWASLKTMSANNRKGLEPIESCTAKKLYLREKATEASENTVKAHDYRLRHFVRWCDGKPIDNLNDLTGRLLKEYRLWRTEDGDLNKVTVKTQMDTPMASDATTIHVPKSFKKALDIRKRRSVP